MQKFLHAVCSHLNSASLGGWDPKAKKKELFNSKSRFILVHPTGDLTTIPLLAFSMFRFENEEDEVVLYW
jgi:N-alpha-acetyltransferase 40